MKIPHRFISLAAALIALPFIYGGCVIIYSSGDHKDKDDDDQNLALVHAPAAINTQNAVAFAAGAIVGGPTSNQPSAPAAGENIDQNIENAFRTMRLPVALAAALGQIEADPAAISFSRSDIIEESGSAAGSCGGQFDFTLDYDRASETLSGRLVFNDYCVDGIFISNHSDVDGFFNLSTGAIVSARFVFEDISVDGLRYAGNLEIDIFNGLIQSYLSIDTVGSSPGEVFALSSYFVDVVRYPGYDEVWVSGTYVHPELGAVELDTTEPFVIHAEDQWPSSGLAVVNGSGETSAALTAMDFTRFRVAADTTGSGRFSQYLGMHDWESLAGEQNQD